MDAASIWLGLAFFASEVALAWRRRAKRESQARAMDDGSLKLLWRVIGGALALGITLAMCNVGPRLPGGVPWGRISIAVFILGTLVRWWAIWHLGRFFTVDVAVAVDHQVVNTGPYRWVRHPSYTGLLLQFTGIALGLANWLSLGIIMLPVGWALLKRIEVEEAALLNTLGAPYAKYTSGTKRLVPLMY